MEWIDRLLNSSLNYKHDHDDRMDDTGRYRHPFDDPRDGSHEDGSYEDRSHEDRSRGKCEMKRTHDCYEESFTITPSLETDQEDAVVKRTTTIYSFSTPQLTLEQLFMNIDPDWYSAAKTTSLDSCRKDELNSSNDSPKTKRSLEMPEASEQSRSKVKRYDKVDESEATDSFSTPKMSDRLAMTPHSSDGEMNSSTKTDETNNDEGNLTNNEDASVDSEQDPFKDKLLAAMALLKKRKISKTPEQASSNSKKESDFKMYTYDVQKDSDGLHIASIYCDSVVIGRATGKKPDSTQRQAFKTALVNVSKCCPKESVRLEKSLFMPPICPRERDWSTNIKRKKSLDLLMLLDICMKERGLPYLTNIQDDFDESFKCLVYSDFVCICCANGNKKSTALRAACGGAIELIMKMFPPEGTPKIFTEKVVALTRPGTIDVTTISLLNQASNNAMKSMPSLLDLTLTPRLSNRNSGQVHISPFRVELLSNPPQPPSVGKSSAQGDFNTYNPFIDKFIIFEEGISKQMDAFSILHQSARFSFVQLMPKFHKEKEHPYTSTSCTLMIDGEFLAEAGGNSSKEAQNNVAALALKRLKTIRPTIRVKESNYISGTIVTHMELFGEDSDFEEDEASHRRNKHSEEPKNQHFHIFGHRSPHDYRNEIVYSIFTPVVQKFVTNLWLDELAFDFEFSNSERFVIHQICHQFNLNSISQGRENNRFLVMSRRRTAQELLADLIHLGGSTSKYELIKPQAGV